MERLAAALLLVSLTGAALGVPLPSFQHLVDATPTGGVLRPKPGTYAGPVLVNRPMAIEGGGNVTIDGSGKGTVFTLQTSGARVRGLKIVNSGESHDREDAGLRIEGHSNTVENNVVDRCLFGIDLKQANYNTVKRNFIRSKPFPLGVRGDGIRLWYSMHNRIEGNRLTDSRDTVVWYSNGNLITNNVGTRSRYSLHFMFSQDNRVEGNRYHDNAVGIYVMYTDGIVVRNNVISHATGATGMGIGFKEASNTTVENNDVIYCAIGIASDLSPFQPDSKIWIRGNRIAYNGVGILFNSEREGNIVTGNAFEGNLIHVAVNGAGSAQSSEWRDNYWDDYEGFDHDRDGRGDTPYDLYAYADRIWMELPQAMFFKSAPFMEVLDFLEKLAPLSNPTLILRDEAPRFDKTQGLYGYRAPRKGGTS